MFSLPTTTPDLLEPLEFVGIFLFRTKTEDGRNGMDYLRKRQENGEWMGKYAYLQTPTIGDQS